MCNKTNIHIQADTVSFLSPPISIPLSHISKVAIQAFTASTTLGLLKLQVSKLSITLGQEIESKWPARNPGILVLLFLSLAQPVELQSRTYLQTGSVITYTQAHRQPHFIFHLPSESVSQCLFFLLLFFWPFAWIYCSLWWGSRATVPLMVRGSGVRWRGCGCGWRGNYARLTHVNLSSVCFVRARARTPLSVRLICNSLCY